MATTTTPPVLSTEAVVVDGQPFTHGEILFTRNIISDRCAEIATTLNAVDYQHGKPLFVCVLKGSVRFFTSVIGDVTVPFDEEYIRVSSMEGTSSTGQLRWILDVQVPIVGRHIVIFEDIVDTGLTTSELRKNFLDRGAAQVDIVTLLHKPAAAKIIVPLQIVGFTIANVFVIGFGLDYEQRFRGLPDISTLVPVT